MQILRIFCTILYNVDAIFTYCVKYSSQLVTKQHMYNVTID